MGSGKVVKLAQNKHGIDNFEKEILEIFDYYAMMYQYEALLVNEEFVARDDTYNLKVGGYGGFDYINSSGIGIEASKKGNKISNELQKELFKDDNWCNKRSNKISDGLKLAYKNGTKTVIQNRELNSIRNKNKRWVKNSELKIRKRIEKEEVEYFLQNNEGWSEGKKF